MKLHKWHDVKRRKLGVERAEQIRRKVEQEILEMNLAELRRELGITQSQMAAAAEMSQSELSRVERRDDHLVSTLRRCVQALGGELEITAHVGGKRVRLSGHAEANPALRSFQLDLDAIFPRERTSAKRGPVWARHQ